MPLKKTLKFPEGFLWGTSSSAYQLEGGNLNNWTEWEQANCQRFAEEAAVKNSNIPASLKDELKKPNNYICGRACDSYNRYEEDFGLAVKMNNNAVRLGVEWSRIEPEEGKWKVGEIEHYKKVLQAAKQRNLKTIVTLWHWPMPLWLEKSNKRGGWIDKNVASYFARYAGKLAGELGGLVDYWVPLNEPMCLIGFGYILGVHPPGRKKDLFGAIKVFNNFVKAHIAGYRAIHNILPDSKVGFSCIVDYFEPARKWNLLDPIVVIIARYVHHRRLLNKISGYLDFIGLNYYFHNKLSWLPPFKVNENKEINDMGWEVYPEGIYHVLKYLSKFKKPIIITENGIADDDDNQRSQFIINHLKYVHQAIREGVDVRGYMHWSLLDNFEWAWGYGPKFGLYSVDRKTFERKPRPSAEVYADICKNNRILID